MATLVQRQVQVRMQPLFRIHIGDISTRIDAYSSVHVHITECRWAELVKAIKYCNEKAQYCLRGRERLYVLLYWLVWYMG